jgi:hypothetical protein
MRYDVFMQKKLLIYRDGVHIQTVTYVKAYGVWTATHFLQDRYMPYTLYLPVSDHKAAMEEEGLTWEWQ